MTRMSVSESSLQSIINGSYMMEIPLTHYIISVICILGSHQLRVKSVWSLCLTLLFMHVDISTASCFFLAADVPDRRQNKYQPSISPPARSGWDHCMCLLCLFSSYSFDSATGRAQEIHFITGRNCLNSHLKLPVTQLSTQPVEPLPGTLNDLFVCTLCQWIWWAIPKKSEFLHLTEQE